VVLRLANVYGPGDTGRVIPIFIANALHGAPLVLFGQDKLLDLVWIGDLLDVLIQAGFGSPPVLEPVNVGSGTATPLEHLAQQIKTLTRSASPIQIIPPRAPEVDRYQASLARAGGYFGLRPNPQPLANLPAVIEAARHPLVETPELFTISVNGP
jgi:UDP-glucose 4-epimerase